MTAELPPRRPMPPEVRERLRRRVLGRSAPGRNALGRNARTVPLTAAATAAALALGGVAFSQVARDESPAVRPTVTDAPPTTTAPSTSDEPHARIESPTSEDLLRCGLTSARQVVVLPHSRLVVGDGLCELSGTGVYRTEDRRISVFTSGARVLHFREGLLVGVASAPDGLLVTVGGASSERSGPSTALMSTSTGDGVFLVRTEDQRTLSLTFGGNRTTTATLTDDEIGGLRRTEPLPGGSGLDEVAGRCADQAWLTGRITDPARWRPVVATEPGAGEHVLVLGDGSGSFLACPAWDWQSRPHTTAKPLGERDFAVLSSDARAGSSTRYLAGVVDERVTAVELTDAQGRPAAEVVLENGWFAARFTDQPEGAAWPDYRVRVFAGEEVLRDGLATTN
ncbi:MULTISPECIES: hypothetical protein [Actinosynnema]|uniref:hypothetical protein n=1 Tax=Actinosynnema TaxID=40566 RepID=UPI0020A57CBA|nr:hypothetical protein [Actinosynnema pretiosum]MCP2099260.1 hypothetical protein [Actinosynnema pretiosum]